MIDVFQKRLSETDDTIREQKFVANQQTLMIRSSIGRLYHVVKDELKVIVEIRSELVMQYVANMSNRGR